MENFSSDAKILLLWRKIVHCLFFDFSYILNLIQQRRIMKFEEQILGSEIKPCS